MAKLDPQHGSTARLLSASVPGRRSSPSRTGRNAGRQPHGLLSRRAPSWVAGPNLPPLLLFDICRECPAAL